MSTPHRSTDDRVAFYGRMSTDQQEASIPEQLDWAKRTAAADGVDLVKCFQDEGIPGSEVERRSGLSDLLAFCEQPPGGKPITTLYLWDADRLSRADAIDTCEVLGRLRRAGVTRFRTPEGWIDLSNVMDRLMYILKQELSSAAFSRTLSKNVARSQLRRALEGEWVAGPPPYGYRKGPDGRLVPGDPDQVEVVRSLFRQYADTPDSLGDLVRRLNERGVPPPRGKRGKGLWRRDTLSRLLTNKAYLGDIVWNATHQGKYSRITGGEVQPTADRRKHGRVKNDSADVILREGAHPPLTDRNTFARVARKLEANFRKRTTPIAGGGEWVLSGLLRCGDCGGRMYGRTENRRHGTHHYTYRHYFCGTNDAHGKGRCRPNTVQQDELVKALVALIHESFTDPAQIQTILGQVEQDTRQAEEDKAGKIQALETSMAKLDADITHGKGNLLVIPPDLVAGAAAMLREWQEERARLARERDQLTQAAVEDEATAARVVESFMVLATLVNSHTLAEPAVVRDMLHALVKSVTIRFDHSLPRNKCHAVEIEVEATPEAVKLLRLDFNSQQVCIRLRGPAKVA